MSMRNLLLEDKPLTAAIIDTMAALVCVFDCDGRVLLFNRACERLTGVVRRKIIGRPIWDSMVPADELADVRAVFRALRDGGRASQHENHWLTADGKRRLIVWSNIAVDGDGGAVRYIVGTGIDVTEQRAAERSARDREARLRAVLHASPDAIVTYEESGVVHSFSPGAEKLFGYAADAVRGTSINALIPPQSGRDCVMRIGEDEAPPAELRSVAASRQQPELTARNRDGASFPIEINVVELTIGGVRYYTGVIHDLTARRRLERIRRGDQEALKSLARGEDVGAVLDEIGGAAERVLGAGACLILGSDQRTMGSRVRGVGGAGRSMREAFETLGPEAEAVLCAATRAGELTVHDRASLAETPLANLAAKARDAGWAAVWSAPIGTPRGERFGVFVVFSGADQPEQWQAEYIEMQANLAAVAFDADRLQTNLREASKMEAIGRLTGGMAHDFNNLLTVVQGNLEMLAARIDDPEMRALTGDALEATALGAQLTEQLLAFSRRQVLQPEIIDVNAALLDIIKIVQRAVDGGVRVNTSLCAEPLAIKADPVQLQTAILNLALNARDAMPSGGVLQIETDTAAIDESIGEAQRADQSWVLNGSDPFVRIAVTDTGVGMSDAMRKEVFEPFFTTKKDGTGLGLSMVYGFVKQSGGFISLYSEEGVGSTFNIYLPAAQAVAPALAAPPAPIDAPLGEGRVVLLVEDEARVQTITRRSLESLDYRVVEAANAAEAKALVDAGLAFDILLTDLVMPGGVDGAALALEMRRIRPIAAIVIMSGFGDPGVISNALSRVDGRYLRKPFTRAQLATTLAEAAGVRR